MEHPILQKIDELTSNGKIYFRELFQNSSQEFLDGCNMVAIQKGTKFVEAEENINVIWVLLSGRVKVLEEYISGDVYIFTRFYAPEIFGEMEAVAGVQNFRASLIAEVDCTFVTIPVSLYLHFLKNDSEALYKRTHIILKHVLDEQRDNRMYMRLKGIDRIKLYFIQHYKPSEADGKCIYRKTRQQIADETGYTVKTINRIIKKLSEQNYLKVEGHKLLITESQITYLKRSMDEKVYYKSY